MSDPFIGEIRAWGMQWPPSGWAYCNGQQASVGQYQALFSILANRYGPTDFRTYFTLPDLRSRVPMGAGAPNATWVATGMPAQIPVALQMGQPTVTVTDTTLPAHTHQAMGATAANLTPMAGTPTTDSFISRLSAPATPQPTVYAIWSTQQSPTQSMHPSMIGVTGGGLPHENRQPFLALNFCIALTGVYPVNPN